MKPSIVVLARSFLGNWVVYKPRLARSFYHADTPTKSAMLMDALYHVVRISKKGQRFWAKPLGEEREIEFRTRKARLATDQEVAAAVAHRLGGGKSYYEELPF